MCSTAYRKETHALLTAILHRQTFVVPKVRTDRPSLCHTHAQTAFIVPQVVQDPDLQCVTRTHRQAVIVSHVCTDSPSSCHQYAQTYLHCLTGTHSKSLSCRAHPQCGSICASMPGCECLRSRRAMGPLRVACGVSSPSWDSTRYKCLLLCSHADCFISMLVVTILHMFSRHHVSSHNHGRYLYVTY